MTAFKQLYYEKLFQAFIRELAESGISLSEEVNEPFVNLLETSLYKALDLTFADIQTELKNHGKIRS